MATAVFESAEEAVARVRDGDTIMVAGFGLAGKPLTLVDALLRAARRELIVISNNIGEPGRGLDHLLAAGQIRKAIGSYFTSNPAVAVAKRAGRLEVLLIPQGTFAEALRAGGAGIPAFFTRASAGTDLAAGKESRVFPDGHEYVLEYALRANVALIHAHTADRLGNLCYRGTARNFNPLMATAADLVIAEVENVVEAGELDPERVGTPHLYVDVVVPL